MRYFFNILLIAIIISPGLAEARSGVYKWIDANGNVVYSEKPPPYGTKALETPFISPTGSPSSSAEQVEAMQNVFKSDEEKQQDKARDDYDQQLKEYCDSLVKNLEVYSQQGRIYVDNDAGERVYLDQNAIQQAIEETRQKQKQYCGKK
jgi:hypothetical protein